MLQRLLDRRVGRYRLQNPVRIDQPLILISQVQRSGGTLLSRLFDDHPEVYAHPYELTWGRPEKWHWPDLDLSSSPSALFRALDQDWIGRLARKAYYKKGPKKAAGTYPFVFDHSLQRDLFVQLVRAEPPRHQRDVLDHYMTSLFNAWYDYQDLYRRKKKFITAFTPRILMFDDSVERFERNYADGFIVSSIRHPAGWYASAVKHKYDTSQGVAGVLDFWMRSTRGILRAKERFGDRLIVLSFETLVAEPVRAMQLVSERVSLPWSDKLTVPTFNGMPVLSNSEYELVSHVDAGAADRYRETIAKDVQAEIDELAGPLLAEAQALILNEFKTTREAAII